MSDVNDALYHLDPSVGRDQWFKILASFKMAGGDMDAAEDWSAQADNYDRQNFRATWRSIREGAYTEKTLFYMAREAGWKPEHFVDVPKRPVEKHPASSGPNPTYKKAKEFWRQTSFDDVASHPYALKKKITHAFGAQRGMIHLREGNGKTDCIVIPQRDWSDRLVGVEAITPQGRKLTYGNKGVLLLGHPEGADLIHVTEGWATMWAVFQLFPRPQAGIVCFGRDSRFETAAEECNRRYKGRVIVHDEGDDNRDVWDLWAAGEGESYAAGILESAI